MSDRIGEISYTNQGDAMKIIEYINARNIVVLFDGGGVKKCTYHDFKRGKVRNPISNKLGEINYNLFGSEMKVVGYKSSYDIDVLFSEYDYVKSKVNYANFKNGNVKCEYDKDVCNIGYIGVGRYKGSRDGVHTKCYSKWVSMINRCYNPYEINRNPTYKDCIVCDEWHNFQNFAQWYEESYYEIENECMDLDKDILVKGNKVYSPDTCVFVPHKINILFTKRCGSRGELPTGVTYNKDCNKFTSRHGCNGENVNLGLFECEVDAFNSYKIAKERYIKGVADEYKDLIPKKLYCAMHEYEVEVTD